ncbi:MAG TPA: hypothetical protein VK928_02160 [Longimicrobiales bacterium]|nr:hypothetical protein [Longimicrobiales bacterium]
MILFLSFEELSALGASAEQVLAAGSVAGHGIVAPPQFLAEVENFAQRLTGDIAVENIDDQRTMERVVDHLVASCRVRMDDMILMQHAAAESAVAAYFEYAHVLTVARRLRGIGLEMAALVELMTGDDPDSDAARRFSFPE